MIGQGLGRVALAERLSISQLEEAIQNRTIPAYIGIPLLEEKTQLEERMRAAQMGMTPQPEMTIADQVMQQANMAQGGIDEIPVEMEMAGGGIVAFEDGGQVQRFQNQGLVGNMTEEELQAQDLGIAPPMPPEQPIVQAAPPQQMFAPLDPNEILTQTEALYGGLYGKGSGAAAPGDKLSYVSKAEEFFKQAGVDLNLAAKQAADIAAEKEALGKDREEAKKMRIIEAGFAILGGTSPNAFENIGKGATQALKGYTSDIKDLQKTERELGDATRKMMQAQNQIRMGVATAAGEDYQKAVERYNAANKDMADRKAGLAEKLISNKNSQMIVQAQMRSNLGETTDIIFKEMVSKGANPNDPKTMADARREAVQLTGLTQLKGQEATDRRKAADLVADKLKKITSLESREYKRILAAQGPAAAEAYKEELINSELRALGRVPSDERGAPRAASEEKVIDFGSIR
jgi:hypothetical protein